DPMRTQLNFDAAGRSGTERKEPGGLMKALISPGRPLGAEGDIVIEKDRGLCSRLVIGLRAGWELRAGIGISRLRSWRVAIAVLVQVWPTPASLVCPGEERPN